MEEQNNLNVQPTSILPDTVDARLKPKTIVKTHIMKHHNPEVQDTETVCY